MKPLTLESPIARPLPPSHHRGMALPKRRWWKESIAYQIYPRSFHDSNGDGIGDLRGIIQKLDHLHALGIDMVWLSPVYQSPNDDNGYDISDYQAIMPEFGTLADWEELLDQLHRRGIKLIMDLVANHTSDEHPWFRESRKSKDNPYRDYYIWRPGNNGREPNNWSSIFGGSAWKYDPATDEYFLHIFSTRQPDLNWENPKVRQDIYSMMHWWLKKGVDGFRLDAINLISKVPGLPEAPADPASRYAFPGELVFNGPRMLEFLQEMNQQVLSQYNLFTVGEMSATSSAQAALITHEDDGHLHTLFHFEHMELDTQPGLPKWQVKPWELPHLKQVMGRWQRDLYPGAWNTVYFSNHDQPRAVSRFGDDAQHRVESAKLLATLLLTLHGTPFIYQGEEIGMTNVRFPSIEDYRDVETLNLYREMVHEKGQDPAAVLRMIYAKGRDNARTPMQWDASAHAGFTTGQPWIGVNPNYPQINAEQDRSAPDSIFAHYQQLIRLRKAHPVLVYGAYEPISDEDAAIYAYLRTLGDERMLVVLNFSRQTTEFALPACIAYDRADRLSGNLPPPPVTDPRQLQLRPYEALVYRLVNASA